MIQVERITLVYEARMTDKLFIRKVDATQLRWFGHVERMLNERLVQVVYKSEVDGPRLRLA